jgi:hypothetical protein
VGVCSTQSRNTGSSAWAITIHAFAQTGSISPMLSFWRFSNDD